MSYRTIYEIVPLVSSRLRSSGSSGALTRPYRSFGSVARATTLTHNPWFSDFDDFWLRPSPRQLSDTMFDLASPLPISSHASRLMVLVVLTHRHHLCCFASCEMRCVAELLLGFLDHTFLVRELTYLIRVLLLYRARH